MNKKFLTLAAGIIALFSACSDNVVLQEPDPTLAVESTAKLTVVVKDAITGVPLEATVTLLSTGAAVPANATTGSVVFSSLRVGDYTLLIEKEGYASKVVTTNIALTAGNTTNNIFIASDKSESVNLPPLSSGLEGYLFYENADGKKVAANTAIVRVLIEDNELADRVFEATVNRGKFTFTGLPAVFGNYSLYALGKTLGGVPYKTKNISDWKESLEPGVTAYVSSTNPPFYSAYDDVTLFTAISLPKAAIDSTEAIEFQFSDAVDIDKISSETINLDGQFADIEWSEDNTVLTLSPKGGKWTKGSFTVILSNLQSVGGKLYNGNIQVTVKSDPLDLPEFKLIPTYEEFIDSTDAIVFVFSQEIDPKSVTVRFNGTQNQFPVDIEVDGETIVITPLDKWTSNFSVYFELKSVRGKYLTQSTNNTTYPSIKLNKSPSDVINFALVQDYKTTIDPTEALVFSFSDAVDTTKYIPDNIVVHNEYGINIPRDVTWGKGEKSVTIEPAGERWASSTISVKFNLTSVNGKTLSETTKLIDRFSIDIRPFTVEGLVVQNKQDTLIDYDTRSVNLIWNHLAGAEGYRVYARASKGSNAFVKISDDIPIGATPGHNDTTYSANNLTGSNAALLGLSSDYALNTFTNGNKIEFVIQAFTAKTETKINETQGFTVSDVVRPYQDTYYQEFDPIYVNGLSGTGKDTTYVQIQFSEPMDTLVSLTPTIGAHPERLKVEPVWSLRYKNGRDYPNDQWLTLMLIVANEEPITTPLNVMYTLSGLRDKSGNLYWAKDENGDFVETGTLSHNQLRIRLRANP